MRVIAFFRQARQVFEQIQIQNRYAEDLVGLHERIYVLVREKGSLFVKRITGRLDEPDFPGNNVVDVVRSNALIDFVELMLDDAFEAQEELSRDGEKISALELSPCIHGPNITDGLVITDSLINYVDTMLNIRLDIRNFKTIAATMMITNQRIEDICTHVGVVRDDSEIDRLLRLSKDYVSNHPNEVVRLTPNYYMKFRETNIESTIHDGTANVFVERM